MNPVSCPTGRYAAAKDNSGNGSTTVARRLAYGGSVNVPQSIDLRASAILASLDQAAFVWDLATDAMAWSGHGESVFRNIPESAIATGAAFRN